MARPPSDWPIPQYDLELRERLLICYTVPAGEMLREVPAPLTPTIFEGRALCSVTLASGRVLKRSGSPVELASEFHLFEVQTPVAWPRACSPTERGLFTLRAASDHAGLNRLLSRCAEKTEPLAVAGVACSGGKVQLSDGFSWWKGATPLRVTSEECGWPTASAIDGAERAEVLLAHPAYRFFSEAEGGGLRAVPVRDYARSTRQVTATISPLEWLAELLEIDAGSVSLDHVLLQKRVTQTMFFPSERIVPLARRAGAEPRAVAELQS